MRGLPESPTAAGALEAFLAARDAKSELRFVVCGSVDDGKSTLLGRLLHDSGQVLEDRMSEAAAESRAGGAKDAAPDLALLIDSLKAEREQGITIDAAYCYFETGRRRFVAIDAPGHEQYTRNMATGASNADLALVLVDARKGVLAQTRRHTRIAALMGVGCAVLAVNKMDLAGYDRDVFAAIAGDYEAFARSLGIGQVHAAPLSALTGENVVAAGGRMPWHCGPPLLELLETVEIERRGEDKGFRLPVQWVNRPHSGFRGFSGTIASGSVETGSPVLVAPSGARTTVRSILGPSGEVDEAVEGQAVTLRLADEIDIGRGDTIVSADAVPEIADRFAAHLVWMDARPMLPERPYLIRFAAASAVAQIAELVRRVESARPQQGAGRTLEMNEIGYCTVSLDRAVPFDPCRRSRRTGRFILIDRFTDRTVGAGVIDAALPRAEPVAWQTLKIDKSARMAALGQKPCVLWFTGLSGAGKSTIADRLEQKLQAKGMHTYLLDGDNIRHGLSKDLGFTDRDRVENIRRIAEVARLMVDAGLIVLVSFISPFRAERLMARTLVEEGEFVEIFVDTPLAVCEARDPKGLYARARQGDLAHFTGIDSPYEAPERPELRLDTTHLSADAAAESVARFLLDRAPAAETHTVR